MPVLVERETSFGRDGRRTYSANPVLVRRETSLWPFRKMSLGPTSGARCNTQRVIQRRELAGNVGWFIANPLFDGMAAWL